MHTKCIPIMYNCNAFKNTQFKTILLILTDMLTI